MVNVPPYLRAAWESRFLRFAILGAVLAWLFDRQDLGTLAHLLAQVDFHIGLAMVAVNLLLVVMFALRWRRVAELLAIRAPWRRFLVATWFSASVGEVGPPLLVVEWMRFRQLRDFGKGWPLLASQVADRLSGQVTLLALVLMLAPGWTARFAGRSTALLAAIAALYLAVAALTVVAARKLQNRPGGGDLTAGLRALAVSPGHYTHSLVIQVLLSGNVLLAAMALGVARDPVGLLLLAPVLLLAVSGLPSLVSDWGKREAAALLVLAPAGLNAEEALAVSLLFGISHTLATLPGWLFGLNLLSTKREG